jgi:hypothetical protein
MAAAALAVSVSCGGSLPPPVTQPAAARPVPSSPGPPGVDVRQPSLPATGALAGSVIHAETRRALARARVTVTSPALPEPRVIITGPDGRFEFRNLPAGAYSVTVTRTGFAAGRFGERRATAPATVPVDDGQRVTGIDVALAPAGVIAGQILDEDNQPFGGARVDALVSRQESGQQTLVSVATAESDDRGNFRLAGLPAGEYYVSAFDPAFANVGDETGALTYTATYYPGTPLVEQATRVPVVPGVEPSRNVVFSLRIVRPARVSGHLATIDRRQLISGAVIMSPVEGAGLVAVASRDVVILPDGTFAFRNVTPGRYQIRARGEVDPGGTALFATFTVAVDGRDVDGLSLTLSPGASVDGSLAVEAVSSPRPLSYAGIRVRAPFADGTSFGDSSTGDVGPDGSFRIRGLMAGSHVITVEGLEYPWVLKSVTHRGQPITDLPFDVESRQEFRDVRVTITDATTDVSGVVRTDTGRAAVDAIVLVIPSSQQFWTRMSRRFGLLRTDASGRYRIRGLPAGEYRALATYDLDESEATRREILQEIVGQGVPISLKDRERRTLDIPLLWLAGARRTVYR